ncbi:uncharacterized protein TRAVEDRAFT_68460 [Trametes versicolor FP-101664 SS1]|uniref:uncharacterized protein n=1 Tax=Trametes versicolor (strain FP-101664) TaxID=717944 RepID=UPI0004621BB9|nr:uncharacterized protein TRAVEDRAFT_68460 [Trametes versicolor FP-101664 SS1]EIW64703.1 hypothetical protein TRAVEDRAFT_68460 [Trametes versicolor FP-101664 SS1]
MDGSRHGEAGVLAWCNTIRFNMAKDPGRQMLHDQIQTQGLDFLDNYLESFFDGPQNEPVIELLKTPGRKKNAPVRTRAAIAAAEKSRGITSLSFEDLDAKENRGPVNEFQKALLRVKEQAEGDATRPTTSHPVSSDRPLKPSASFAKLKTQKIVTIADSPAVQSPGRDDNRMDLDEDLEPIPAVQFALDPPSMEPALPDAILHESQEAIKDLSMIAEDDEPAERSRVSLPTATIAATAPSQALPQVLATHDVQDVFHDVPQEPPQSSEVPTDDEPDEPPIDAAEEIEEPPIGKMTSGSSNTFHSIALDSPRAPEPERPIRRADDNHTAPLPKMSLPPVPIDEDAYSHTAPLPSSSSRHQEYTLPLREEPSAPVPGLSRKPSVTQFAGLPAPSPLRKSLRVPGDPTTTSGGGTTAPPPGGKRTSWLSKARETKALETTAKRTSTLGQGLGLTVFSNKRKSGEMLESARDMFAPPNTTLKPLEEEQRVPKMAKLSQSPDDTVFDGKGKGKTTSPNTAQDTIPRSGTVAEVTATAIVATTTTTTSSTSLQADDDVLGLLKKTAAGYGARVGKSMGKSLGGNAAAALAEARAQAEARVAERHKLAMGLAKDSEDVSMTSEDQPFSTDDVLPTAAHAESERRLSVSDLVPTSHGTGKATSAAAPSSTPPDADTSTSTTPPNSPPPPPPPRATTFSAPTGPVFSKPTAPPAPIAPSTLSAAPSARMESTAGPSVGRDFSFKIPNNPFSIPAAMTLGMGSKFAPLSAQSSKASIFSDVVFDTNNMSPQPSWMPSTQDTSYSAGGSQSQPKATFVDDNDDLDEDDSWGVEEKFAAHQTWTPFGFSSVDPGTAGEQAFKDDTMTWSTQPSRSTTGSIAPTQNFFSILPQSKEEEEDESRVEEEVDAPEDFAARLAAAAHQASDADDGLNEADMAMEIDDDVEDVQDDDEKEDLEEAILKGKPTVTLVQQSSKSDLIPEHRSESQQSMASTASSSQQSQLGFFGQASKLVSSVLGGSKKSKPEVKSLQLAAAAAKKQQEEQEKKAARMKDMENRRQQAMQRKAEEEKTRALEEERKIKEEAERRKREREEHTDKRPLRSTTTVAKKADEDNTQKRKLAAPTSKPPSKDKKDSTAPPRLAKPSAGPGAASSSKPSGLPKSALKQPASSVPVTPGAAKAAPKTVKHVPSSSNLKSAAAGPSKGKAPAREASEPPAAKSTKAAADSRAAAGPPAGAPQVTSESIELPDINSEYSDSDDEDRPSRKRALPDWAQSPDIAAALQQQSTINPDDIFGRIGPLRMEEIFRTRQSRFRARTSSANWTGTDELTAEEEREYARRMGFR